MTPSHHFDFSAYIADHTRDFVGREWVFAEIDAWLADPDAPRFFIITGEPGIGKTAIAARLTQVREFDAYHFCIARQADTIDPYDFVHSLSLQLARIEGFARDLLDEQHIHIETHQTIQQIYGQVIGVKIENLCLQTHSATAIFNRIIGDPLKRLYYNGLARPLLILVDALDEAMQFPTEEKEKIRIVDLLANAQGLPLQVRFVLTSRPESEVLRHFGQLHIPYLTLEAGGVQNQTDAREYVSRRLADSDSLRFRLAKEAVEYEAFIQRVIGAAKGNFLYLTWLLRTIEAGTQRFDSLEALPEGLDGIYREFLCTRMLYADKHAWRRRYRPLLGVLAVAQAALTQKQLIAFTGLDRQAVRDTLEDVRQFLDPTNAGENHYRLYHQSLANFLGDETCAEEFWIDLTEAHNRIADSYLQAWGGEECGELLSSLTHTGADEALEYGLKYVATHLSYAKQYQKLFQLLNRDFMSGKLRWYGSHHSFVGDLQLAIHAAAQQQSTFPELAKFVYLKATLNDLTSKVPYETLEFLVKLGGKHRQNALRLIEMMPYPESRVKTYCRLASQDHDSIFTRRYCSSRDMELLDRALTTIAQMPESQQKQQLYARIAPDLARGGQLEKAKAVVNQLSGDSTYVRLDVARATGAAGNLEQAWQLFQAIPEREFRDLEQMVTDITLSRDPEIIEAAIRFFARDEKTIDLLSWLCNYLQCDSDEIRDLLTTIGVGKRKRREAITRILIDRLVKKVLAQVHSSNPKQLPAQQFVAWIWMGRYDLVNQHLQQHPEESINCLMSCFSEAPFADALLANVLFGDYYALSRIDDVEILTQLFRKYHFPAPGGFLQRWLKWSAGIPDHQLLEAFKKELAISNTSAAAIWNLMKMLAIAGVRILKAGRFQEMVDWLDAGRRGHFQLEGLVSLPGRLARAGFPAEAVTVAKLLLSEEERLTTGKDITAALLGAGRGVRCAEDMLKRIFKSPVDRCRVFTGVAQKLHAVSPELVHELGYYSVIQLLLAHQERVSVEFLFQAVNRLLQSGKVEEPVSILQTLGPTQHPELWAQNICQSLALLKTQDPLRSQSLLEHALRVIHEMESKEEEFKDHDRATAMALMGYYLAQNELYTEAKSAAVAILQYENPISAPRDLYATFIANHNPDQNAMGCHSLVTPYCVYDYLYPFEAWLEKPWMKPIAFCLTTGQLELARNIAQEEQRLHECENYQLSSENLSPERRRGFCEIKPENWYRWLKRVYIKGMLDPDKLRVAGKRNVSAILSRLAWGCEIYSQFQKHKMLQHARLLGCRLTDCIISFLEQTGGVLFDATTAFPCDLPCTAHPGYATDAELFERVYKALPNTAFNAGIFPKVMELLEFIPPPNAAIPWKLQVAESLATGGNAKVALTLLQDTSAQVIEASRDTCPTIYGLHLDSEGKIDAACEYYGSVPVWHREDIISAFSDTLLKNLSEQDGARLKESLLRTHPMQPKEVLDLIWSLYEIETRFHGENPDLLIRIARAIIEVDSWWD